MTINLSDPRLAAEIAGLVDRRVEYALRQLAPQTRYGTVSAVDVPNRVATVLVGGATVGSPGFVFPGYLEPTIGDVVRVVTRGADRYIDDNLSKTSVGGEAPVALLALKEAAGTNQTGIGASVVDVTGLTGMTFSLTESRRIKATVFALTESNTGPHRTGFELDAVGNIVVLNNLAMVRVESTSGSNSRATAYGARTIVLAAGAYNYKIRASTPTGGSNIANAITPAWAAIEDMGPATALELVRERLGERVDSKPAKRRRAKT